MQGHIDSSISIKNEDQKIKVGNVSFINKSKAKFTDQMKETINKKMQKVKEVSNIFLLYEDE